MSTNIVAQNNDYITSNQHKYWHYRERLKNDFEAIGNFPGGSLIAEKRNNGIEWSDNTINLGWYISVLASEYYLLKNEGKDVSATKEELYYAITAFNRLDEMAEPYWQYYYGKSDPVTGLEIVGAPSAENGFFIRDDVRNDFLSLPYNGSTVQNHLNSLQYTQIPISQASQLVDPCLSGFGEQHTNGINSAFQIGVEKDRININQHQYNGKHIGPREMSQDQIWPIFMGMSLISNYVDPTDSYNGMNFVTEAKDITDRIMTYLISHAWIITNPVTDECVKGVAWTCNENLNGSFELCNYGGSQGCLVYAHGIAEAACAIVNDSRCLLYQSAAILHIPIWTALNQNWIPDPEDVKVLTIAAIGNSWGTTSTTQGSILSKAFGANYRYEISYLLHQVLYGRTQGNADLRQYWESLMSIAPCDGPQDNEASGQWNTYNRFRETPPAQNQYNPNVPSSSYYNGLDYLLLHNLYYMLYKYDFPNLPVFDPNITNPNYSYTINSPDFPYIANLIPLITIGEQNVSPFVLNNNVQTLYATNIVHYNADVTYRASNEIILEGEFEAEFGSEFEAYIDSYTCINGVYQKKNSNNNQSDENRTSTTATILKEKKTNNKPNSNVTQTSVYPNPSSGIITIELNNINVAQTEIAIFNYLGEKIISKNTALNIQNKLDLSNYADGWYCVKITDSANQKIYTHKIHIVHNQ